MSREPCARTGLSESWREGDGSPALWALLVLCAVGGSRSPSHLPEEPAMKIYFREKESTHTEKIRQEQSSGRKQLRAGQ